jgi:hypothetical protein
VLRSTLSFAAMGSWDSGRADCQARLEAASHQAEPAWTAPSPAWACPGRTSSWSAPRSRARRGGARLGEMADIVGAESVDGPDLARYSEAGLAPAGTPMTPGEGWEDEAFCWDGRRPTALFPAWASGTRCCLADVEPAGSAQLVEDERGVGVGAGSRRGLRAAFPYGR